MLGALTEKLTIRQLGQFIVIGKIVDFGFRIFAFSNVADDREHGVLVASYEARFEMNAQRFDYVFVNLWLAGLECAFDARSRRIIVFTGIKIDLRCRGERTDLQRVCRVRAAQSGLHLAIFVDNEDQIGYRADEPGKVTQGAGRSQGMADPVRQHRKGNRSLDGIGRTGFEGLLNRHRVVPVDDQEDGYLCGERVGPKRCADRETVLVG